MRELSADAPDPELVCDLPTFLVALVWLADPSGVVSADLDRASCGEALTMLAELDLIAVGERVVVCHIGNYPKSASARVLGEWVRVRVIDEM